MNITFYFPKGAFVNAIFVVFGSLLGLLIGNRLKENYKNITISAIGLITLLIGFKMALETKNLIVVIVSLVLGGTTGELLKIDDRLNNLAKKFKGRLKATSSTFEEGFITATLIFTVGAMTIVGSIQEGLSGNATLIYTKSALDFITSITLAAGLGIGVLFSSLSVLVIQGLLTLLGSFLGFLLKPDIISEITATGGVIIIGLGLLILDIKKVKVINFLPALIYATVITLILSK